MTTRRHPPPALNTQKIPAGTTIVDHYGRPWPELQKQTEHAFEDLAVLLTRLQQTNAGASSDEKG